MPLNVLRFAARNLWRDLKSGELAVLLLALSVAVLSLTAVGFFTSRIAQGVRAQATEVLAADLRLESPDPTPESLFAEARARGLSTARTLSFPTAIFNGDASQLAAIVAVSAAYPLRGHLRVADTPFGIAHVAARDDPVEQGEADDDGDQCGTDDQQEAEPLIDTRQ